MQYLRIGLGITRQGGMAHMNQDSPKVILTQMSHRQPLCWPEKQMHTNKRLLRNTAFFAAVFLCGGGFAWLSVKKPEKVEAVMSHLTAGFEYDETLGRVQLVNNMLPESVMVFLNSDSTQPEFGLPTQAQVSHQWSEQEPWLEYTCMGDVSACQTGEVVTIVENHAGTHTMRILHDDGYESVYSGLCTVHVSEHDNVLSGQVIGTSAGTASFELRKDGISVLPTFSAY